MSSARDRILASIRSGLPHAELPGATEARPVLPPAPAAAAPNDLSALFEAALTALTGTVHHAATPAAVAHAVASIAASCGAGTYLAWDEAEIGCPGLFEALTARGLRRVTYDLPFDAGGRDAGVRALEDVGLGITGADAGLADGGALVLASGPGRGRLASLLPPVHVAILSASKLIPSLPALLAARPDLVGRGSNFVAIAGPSRTADIEMTLTHGVHGPKHVHVILTA